MKPIDKFMFWLSIAGLVLSIGMMIAERNIMDNIAWVMLHFVLAMEFGTLHLED